MEVGLVCSWNGQEGGRRRSKRKGRIVCHCRASPGNHKIAPSVVSLGTLGLWLLVVRGDVRGPLPRVPTLPTFLCPPQLLTSHFAFCPRTSLLYLKRCALTACQALTFLILATAVGRVRGQVAWLLHPQCSHQGQLALVPGSLLQSTRPEAPSGNSR